jgi:hypothetical protein
MRHVTIAFPPGLQERVWGHLRSNQDGDEEAAFLFADIETTPRGVIFHVHDWYKVEPTDYASRGFDGIELTDSCRGQILKRAHDEGRSLLECHSHPGWRQAVFSRFDFEGFEEFVPHVRWRLKGRPYAAVVVADTSFDALAWVDPDITDPVAVDAVAAGIQLSYPTRHSLTRWKEVHRGKSL